MWNLGQRRNMPWIAQAANLTIIFALLIATGYAITLICIPFIKPGSVMLINVNFAGVPLLHRAKMGEDYASMWAKAELIFEQLPLLNHDALIIWRAWVILAKKRWVLALLATLWFATAATLIAYYVAFLQGNDHIIDAISNTNSVLATLQQWTVILTLNTK
ncbi:hypothetical protein H0H92_002869 [Tricholoma furcatifolium]|nr:hypothetical protein H0H92_002869 [Tricholoma furcatifolium]